MCLAIFIFTIQHFSVVSAEPDDNLKAAFIRSNDLWIKIGEKEMKITDGVNVKFPKWSFDGNWIAYIGGSKEDEITIHEGELWLYNVKSKKHFRVFSNVSTNFQWASNQNILGFQSDEVLNIIDVQIIKSTS